MHCGELVIWLWAYEGLAHYRGLLRRFAGACFHRGSTVMDLDLGSAVLQPAYAVTGLLWTRTQTLCVPTARPVT
jgi:hypothetical protein